MLFIRFYIVFALLFACVWPLASWGQTARLLRFESPTITVDTLKSTNGKKRLAFKCRNITNSKVIILDVRTQCSCLQPQFSKSPIEAGGTATIYAELDPKDLYGDLSKSLTVVATNGNYKRFNTLTVVGYVDAGITISQVKYPYQIIDGLRSAVNAIGMRQIARGEVTVKRMVVYNDTKNTLFLKIIDSDSAITVSVPQKLEPAQTGEIEVRFSSAGMRIGAFVKTLTLDVRNVGQVKIAVKGVVK